MSEQTKLPTIQELHHAPDVAFKQDSLNYLLNQQPQQQWIKQHPFAKGVNYLPIDKVEFLLVRIFGGYEVEVIDTKQLLNSIAVHIRLKVKNPVTGEIITQDGLGAVGVQTNAGASASDLGAIKQDAVMKALPAAESYAIKDAAEKLGQLFGGNLNRKDIMNVESYNIANRWNKEQ